VKLVDGAKEKRMGLGRGWHLARALDGSISPGEIAIQAAIFLQQQQFEEVCFFVCK
jgi:hypothetical protein